MLHTCPTLLIAAIFISILIAVTLSGTFTLVFGELVSVCGIIVAFLGCGFRMKRLKKKTAASFLKISGLFYLMAATAALDCSALARTALPYADDILAAADRALGFDWLSMMFWFQASPMAANILIKAYAAFNWQPQLAILLLCVFGPHLEAYRFITAWALCLLLTVISYPFFPAIAAFHFYGVDPLLMPGETAWASWHLRDIMDGLRSGANSTLGADQLTGIVTMPSFHAAAAILLIWAYWPFLWLRWPFAILNSVMFVSAVPVGGHYLVDVLAGLILALIAILIASRVHQTIADRVDSAFQNIRPSFA
jgi:membrane-associated phospholipid phosphatase